MALAFPFDLATWAVLDFLRGVNVHHLELFYYVAKFEGITNAVRCMPYPIQQPAVSGQLLQLEGSLGVKLFQRRPFQLTPEGERLYDFIYPFYSRLPSLQEWIRQERSQHLRLAASATVLSSHLPDLLSEFRQDWPELRLSLHQVNPSEAELLLTRQEVDLAISAIPSTPARGLTATRLLEIPLLLLAPPGSRVASIEGLASTAGSIELPLISLPPHEPLAQTFEKELSRRGLLWPPQIEVSNLETIRSYVAQGFGYGLSVAVPGVAPSGDMEEIPLNDFPSIEVGLLHGAPLKPVAQAFLEKTVRQAANLIQ
ncbi:MAG: LysR family transcriptional regulator [Verrucomicrobiota bacterium]